MRDVKVDRSDPLPLHEQVASEIRKAIADGEAPPGERLPPAVDLAAVLGVNRNTVLRALRMLRDEGIVDFTRGRGVTVTGTPQQGMIRMKVAELIEIAHREGYRRDELIAMLQIP